MQSADDVRRPGLAGSRILESGFADPRLAHPLKPMWLAGALTMPLWALSVAITCVVAGPQAPRPVLLSLLALASLVVLLGAAGCVALLARDPRTALEAAKRSWHARAVIACAHASCLGLIWLVMPRLDVETQFMFTVFMTAYIPAIVIGSPENTAANRAGIVLVIGSTAALLVTRPSTHAQMLGAYMAVFGVTMFVLSGTIRRTVDRAFWAQRASDEQALALARLAESLAAERDAKTRFIATASHDLGQPLQAAALFFDQASRATDPAERDRASDGVRRAFSAADRLLSHMLNHLRLEADAVEPQPSPTKLSALLARVAAQNAPAAAAAGMRIRVAAGGPTLTLDPVLAERALGNLVHNAIQHSGGTKILLAARRDGPRDVRIWVIDDGAGVGLADAPHIFDDYYRGSSRLAAVTGGFGLGLSSVRRLARLMGGEAARDPRWRRGSAFYLRLPAIQAPGPRARLRVAA